MSKRRLLVELPLGPYRIPVWYEDGLKRKEDADSIWRGDKMEIGIDSSVTGPDWWACLIHELTHAIAATWSLRKADDENVCDTFGNGFAQALGPLLGPPPESRPLLPLGPDDDTPAVPIPNLLKPKSG